MNVEKLNAAVAAFRERLGNSVLTCDVWGPDGLSIVGFAPNPTAVALFTDLTSRVGQALGDSGFPGLDSYYVIDLEDHMTLCVIRYREYQWGALIDRRRIVLGRLLTSAVPKAIEDMAEALDG